MREVCVWGTGINSINFTYQHMERIKIIAYIDNHKAKEGVFDNGRERVKILHPDEAEALIRKYFVIVAVSENTYWDIKKQLDSLGLSEFSDYCFHEVYEKKIAVIYGNCHVTPIKEGLGASHAFSEQYGFYPMRLIQCISQNDGEDLKSRAFECCDLLIHQAIQKQNRYGEEYASENILKNVNKKSIVIAIPNLYGLPKCFFPQMAYDMPEKWVNGVGYFSWRDKYIEQMYFDRKGVEDIITEIKFGEVANAADLIDQYDYFIEKVRSRECEWDIKIADWIIQTNTEQLFYDINHPTGVVMRYIIREIMKILQLEADSDLSNLYELDTYELPIYGQVMKVFKMEWKNNYILRKHRKYTLTNRQIDLEQYVEQYIKWNCS